MSNFSELRNPELELAGEKTEMQFGLHCKIFLKTQELETLGAYRGRNKNGTKKKKKKNWLRSV